MGQKMPVWDQGYFAQNGYAYGFYPETMPTHIQWACALQSHQTKLSKFRYLDAGCGQGLNLILAAACHPDSEFVGIDFLPDHIAHARSLAERAGLKNISFIEGDFIELSKNPDRLGEFDYVICHGISTWVSPLVRESLFRLVGQVLAPGGVFYNSYNTQPGWLTMMPFQNLVKLHLKDQAPRRALARSKSFFEDLIKAMPGAIQFFPDLRVRLSSLDKQDLAYLFQEYNHEHWQPMFVSDMIQCMEGVKLSYLGTATLAEIDDTFFPASMKALFIDEESTLKKEQLKDYTTNKSFRRDVYVKGHNTPWKLQSEGLLGDFSVIYNPLKPLPSSGEDFRFSSGALNFDGNREFYLNLIAMASRHPNGIQLKELVASQSVKERRDHVIPAVNLLIGSGYFNLLNRSQIDPAGGQRLNKILAKDAINGAPYNFACLPTCGGAIMMQDIDWIIFASDQGVAQNRKLHEHIFERLTLLGRAVARDGVPVLEIVQASPIIISRINAFEENKRPFLQIGGAI